MRVVVLAVLFAVAPVLAELKPGDTLGTENWEQARGLLPDEFLEAYKRGDFRHRIGELQIDRIGDDPVFRAAMEANRGRFGLDADGSIIDLKTGQAPDYVYAWPFPEIDANDPQAAMKIVWNYFYTLYYGGNGHYRADLLWVSRRGLDRAIEVDSFVKHYDGQHPRFREPSADRELLTQTLAEVRAPADVNGIVSLAWRWRGADKRDSIWTFVPALRRVRQVSPANRSDGFLGSDLTQDDGAYFEGKVQDFTWRLVGEQDLLVLFDEPSLTAPAQLERLPEGGWRMLVPGGARVGYQVPGWKGAPWCPVQEVLIRRPHWVVEAIPKDPYYLFGKLVFRFDKELYMGSYSSKYDWQGALIGSFSAIRTNIVRAAPGELWGWAGGAVAVALNWKLDRATTAGIVAGRNVPADSRIPLSPQLFSLQRLNERGR
ncbi:MAG: outer membrane lipoprotein-sorting protein [Deltaproteobacteria bacterium]|nr:outer membrane lipoprotein-sorting protein [Deltaproteobacteria bacterium]